MNLHRGNLTGIGAMAEEKIREHKMNFGIPKEIRPFENRVSLTPAAVDSLVRAGHTVFFEHEAGQKAGFADEEYVSAGGQLVYTAAEAYGRADVVVKVGRPMEAEYRHFVEGQTIFSFLHLAVASADLLKTLQDCKITAIGCETMETDSGELPVLQTTSDIAGRLAPILAGELLGSFKGGRGILLSGIPGIPPAAVVILGAGVLGTSAARAFHNLGADVTLLDDNLEKLQRIDQIFGGQLATMFATPHNIAKTVKFADVLLTAASHPGKKAPVLITRPMLKTMRRRAVILDLAINSGGNVETSRPTTLANPSFIEEEIIHYCVPNVPSRVARTGSHAFSNVILPYLLEIGRLGLGEALHQISTLKRGVNTLRGKLVHQNVAAAIGHKTEDEK